MFSKIALILIIASATQAAPGYHELSVHPTYFGIRSASIVQQPKLLIPQRTIPIVEHGAPIVAQPMASQVGHKPEYHDHPKYEFVYGVEDHHTGDIHSQKEARDGDKVQGEYSLHEADGSIRVVKYTADKHNGFNAIVTHIQPSKAPLSVKA